MWGDSDESEIDFEWPTKADFLHIDPKASLDLLILKTDLHGTPCFSARSTYLKRLAHVKCVLTDGTQSQVIKADDHRKKSEAKTFHVNNCGPIKSVQAIFYKSSISGGVKGIVIEGHEGQFLGETNSEDDCDYVLGQKLKLEVN